MTSRAHLQQEAAQARNGLSSAIDDLKSSVTTAALTNGAMTFAREGSSAVARATVDRAMANPLAAMLIGAGIVMLMSQDKTSAVGAAIDKGNGAVRDAAGALGSLGESLMGAASSAVGMTRQATGDAVETAKDAAGKVASAATDASNLATDTYGKVKDMVAEGQAQGTRAIEDMEKRVAETRTRLEKFADEQPVVVAALGLAFGAALGASLPLTDAERTYMGEVSRKVTAKGSDVALQVADSVTDNLASSNVPGKVAQLVDSVASTVKTGLKG